jgi:hypothetical protein
MIEAQKYRNAQIQANLLQCQARLVRKCPFELDICDDDVCEFAFMMHRCWHQVVKFMAGSFFVLVTWGHV